MNVYIPIIPGLRLCVLRSFYCFFCLKLQAWSTANDFYIDEGLQWKTCESGGGPSNLWQLLPSNTREHMGTRNIWEQLFSWLIFFGQRWQILDTGHRQEFLRKAASQVAQMDSWHWNTRRLSGCPCTFGGRSSRGKRHWLTSLKYAILDIFWSKVHDLLSRDWFAKILQNRFLTRFKELVWWFDCTHRIHGAAIYGNMDPINIPPMLAYIPAHTSTMDPMGYTKWFDWSLCASVDLQTLLLRTSLLLLSTWLRQCRQGPDFGWPRRAMAIQKVEAPYVQWLGTRVFAYFALPMGSMYAIDGNIYHQYTPNVSIYTIHGSYGL